MLTKEEVIETLKSYEDPELQIDVWTLGLIYDIEIVNDIVKIKLTFTSPMCPYGPHMVDQIIKKIKDKGAKDVQIEIVFDPPWQPSEELREMLGI